MAHDDYLWAKAPLLKGSPGYYPSLLVGDMGNTPSLKKAPEFLKDALVFPYFAGLTFSRGHPQAGGCGARFQQFFPGRPVSTQQ